MRRGSVVIAFAVMWTAYTVIFTGYSWIRGYNIGFREIVSPLHWYSGKWPPGIAPNDVIIPTGGGSGSDSTGPPTDQKTYGNPPRLNRPRAN